MTMFSVYKCDKCDNYYEIKEGDGYEEYYCPNCKKELFETELKNGLDYCPYCRRKGVVKKTGGLCPKCKQGHIQREVGHFFDSVSRLKQKEEEWKKKREKKGNNV